MEDHPGTIIITTTPNGHKDIIAFAEQCKWLLVGLKEGKITYLTPSGQLVQIKPEEAK